MRRPTWTRLLGALALGLLPLCAFAYSADDYYRWGFNYYQTKDYAKAEPYFKYALQLDPNDYRSAEMLGTCEALLGDSQKAAADFQKSLQLHPDNPALVKYMASLSIPASPTPLSTPFGVPTAPLSVIGVGAVTTAGPSGPSSAPLDNPHYTWDPAVDPYPLYAGPADPLPKPKIPIYSNLYLNLSYDIDLAYFNGFSNDSPVFIFGTPSLKLDWDLDPYFSLGLGTQFWPKLHSTGQTLYYQLTRSNDFYQVWPIFLKASIHLRGPSVSFDAGFGPSLFFYNNKIDEETDEYDYYYDTTYVNLVQGSDSGVGFAGLLDFDMTFGLDPKNQFELFLNGQFFLSPALGLSNYNLTFTNIENDPPSAPVTSSYQESATGANSSLSIVGGALGAGIRVGF
ncbi:MAG TPA: tetratricopeptide repeat protein [bacterium]|nr:tetratricopeptide repeat protein [bacterium]